jgi:hypothetical protein
LKAKTLLRSRGSGGGEGGKQCIHMCVNKNLKKKKAKDVTLSDEIFNVS